MTWSHTIFYRNNPVYWQQISRQMRGLNWVDQESMQSYSIHIIYEAIAVWDFLWGFYCTRNLYTVKDVSKKKALNIIISTAINFNNVKLLNKNLVKNVIFPTSLQPNNITFWALSPLNVFISGCLLFILVGPLSILQSLSGASLPSSPDCNVLRLFKPNMITDKCCRWA